MTTYDISSSANARILDNLGYSSLGSIGDQGFLISALYTPRYRTQAARLEASLRAVGLGYALFEVPQVHRSMSRHGSDDAAFTKPAFIRALLDRYQCAIAYVDADVVFRSPPLRIASIVAARRDFAIYNWLADEHTDAFKSLSPIPGEPAPSIQEARYLGYSHSVDHFGPEQILCSGMTQIYGNTAAARALLGAWAEVIAEQPGVADDHCLDYAFNNGFANCSISASWLDKAYARYAWWIYVKPVIDHPDPASAGTDFARLTESGGRRRHHADRLELRRGASIIPRDCIIDVQQRMLYRTVSKDGPGGQPELVAVARLEHELFLDR